MDPSNYKGRSILCIGSSRKVLSRLAEELGKEGFHADYLNAYRNRQRVVQQYQDGQYDLIAFGPGVTAADKVALMQEFNVLNPDVRFIEGLAPIAGLVVDQVKQEYHNYNNRNDIVLDWVHKDELTIRIAHAGSLVIYHYRLSWLQRSSGTIIFQGTVEAGAIRIPFFKRNSGKNFIVIHKDGKVVTVAPV
jgi:hypothetical protein